MGRPYSKIGIECSLLAKLSYESFRDKTQEDDEHDGVIAIKQQYSLRKY